KLVVDIPLYHKREGYAVGKVQFSDFGNDFQVRCTKLTLVKSRTHSGKGDRHRLKPVPDIPNPLQAGYSPNQRVSKRF
ncbi:MAG: hypothetical protein PVI80_18835, partial [Anaerolineae bacterium]